MLVRPPYPHHPCLDPLSCLSTPPPSLSGLPTSLSAPRPPCLYPHAVCTPIQSAPPSCLHPILSAPHPPCPHPHALCTPTLLVCTPCVLCRPPVPRGRAVLSASPLNGRSTHTPTPQLLCLLQLQSVQSTEHRMGHRRAHLLAEAGSCGALSLRCEGWGLWAHTGP